MGGRFKWLDSTKKRRNRNEKPYSEFSVEEKRLACARSRASAAKKPELKKAHNRAYVYRLRVKTLAAYGKSCVCCGEREPRFLALDHVNNDGAAHRKALKGKDSQAGLSPQTMFRWLKARGFPDSMQILCHNCNMAKGLYGVCPHESMRRLVGEG